MRAQYKVWTRHSHMPFCWSAQSGRRSVQHLRQHSNSLRICLGSIVGSNTRTESFHDDPRVADQPNELEESFREEKISGDDVRDLQALLDGFKSQLSRLDKEVSEKADLEKLQAKFATQQAALEKMHKAIMENEKTYQEALEKDRIRLAELERVLSETEAYLTKDLEPERKNLEEKCRQLEKETEELRTKIKSMAESSKTLETSSTKSPETTSDVKVPESADTTELEKKWKAAEDEKAKILQEMETLKSSDSARQAEMESLEEELKRALDSQKPSKAQVQTKETGDQIQALTKELEKARANDKRQADDLADAANVATVLTGELERLKKLVTELESSSTKSSAEKDQVEKLQILLKESEDAYKKLLGEKESEKQARSEAVREVSSLKDLLEEIEAENEDLTRLSDMQDEIERERAAAIEMRKRAEETRKQADEEMQEAMKLKEQVLAISSARQLENGSPELMLDPSKEEDMHELLRELETLVDQVDAALASEASALKRAEEAEKHANSLQSQLASLQEAANEGAKLRQADSETATTLQLSLKEAEKLAETLKGEKASLIRKLEGSSDQVRPEPSSRNNEAERQIVDLEHRVQSLQAENDSLRSPGPSQSRSSSDFSFSTLSPISNNLQGNPSDLVLREHRPDQSGPQIEEDVNGRLIEDRQNAMLRNAVEDSIHTGNLLGERYTGSVQENNYENEDEQDFLDGSSEFLGRSNFDSSSQERESFDSYLGRNNEYGNSSSSEQTDLGYELGLNRDKSDSRSSSQNQQSLRPDLDDLDSKDIVDFFRQ